MRIAFLNATTRPVGGIGTYLAIVIASLARRGHEIGFWHESGGRPDGDPFALPANSRAWSVEEMGPQPALDALRRWRPEVLFNHGLLNHDLEEEALLIAPAVFIAHTYYGTCISGAKAFSYPTTVPCSRTFGWPCLVNYYPRRCGGWSPVTMVSLYRQQVRRLDLLSRYKAIVTYSSHMQQEFARHGLDAAWVKGPAGPVAPERRERSADERLRLLFAGRMEPLKGGAVFLDALPRVLAGLGRPLHVTCAGDGPSRRQWEDSAMQLASREPAIQFDFPGWLDRDRVDGLMTDADLLVLPSLWPEPFGLVGLEAARHGLPVAAFAVGGIPDWLRSGVNGYLAPGDPPTAEGLAGAIVACLQDPATDDRLREGAIHIASEFAAEHHVDTLVRILADAAR